MMHPAGEQHDDADLAPLLALLRHRGTAPRGELAASVIGTTIALPPGTPLWRHTTPDGRQLRSTPIPTEPLVVHAVEPASSSYLMPGPGVARARRGPAVTLRGQHGGEELLVVFASDLDAEQQ